MSKTIKNHPAVESVEYRDVNNSFDGLKPDYLVHLKGGWVFTHSECGTRSFETVKEFLDEPKQYVGLNANGDTKESFEYENAC